MARNVHLRGNLALRVEPFLVGRAGLRSGRGDAAGRIQPDRECAQDPPSPGGGVRSAPPAPSRRSRNAPTSSATPSSKLGSRPRKTVRHSRTSNTRRRTQRRALEQSARFPTPTAAPPRGCRDHPQTTKPLPHTPASPADATDRQSRQRIARLLAIGAIPPRNPHPRRKLANIRAMTVEAAPNRTAAKAGRGTCLTPCLPANVLFGGQSALVAKLQWPSHGPASVIARADPLLKSRKPGKTPDATKALRTNQPEPETAQPGDTPASRSTTRRRRNQTPYLERKTQLPYRANP